MEVPLHSPRTRHLDAPIRIFLAGTARVRNLTAFPSIRHSSFCWKSSFSDQRLAIASARSPLFLRTLDVAVLCKSRPPPPPPPPPPPHSNSSPWRSVGKHRDPHLVSSPSSSDATLATRKKDDALAAASEKSRHNPNFTSSKALSSRAITINSGSKDILSGEYRRKFGFPIEAHLDTSFSTESSDSLSGEYRRKLNSPREARLDTAISTESNGKSVSRRESRSKQVFSRDNGVDYSSSDKGSVKSGQWKKTSSNKELLSNNRSEETASVGPTSARTHSAGPSRRRRKFPLLSQAQIEEEKAKKHAEVKERVAMAEANGFRLSKRVKKNPEEVQYVLKLNLCSKHGDLHGALEIYDTVKKGKIFNLKLHHYNVLLYICSGAASGSIIKGKSGKEERASSAVTSETNKQLVRGSEESMEEASKGEGGNAKVFVMVSFSPEDMQLAARRGTEIYDDMLQAKIPPNEATFTAVARLAVGKGDGDLAFETVKKMAAAGITPKLRSYGPALLCFCQQNQVEKAFDVDDHMAAASVLADENLLEALLRLSIAAGLEAKVYALLQRLRNTVRDVSPATVLTIERWFNSEAAASAGNFKCESPPSKDDIREAAESKGGGWHGLGWLGEGKWITKRTSINKAGVCQSCGETLCTIDLDPEETEKFARSVAELAMQRERNPNEFVTFQGWLEKNGPFEAILDGANIGMYNSALRGFNYNQVATVASALKGRSLIEKPPLIVLHCRRTSDGGSRSPRLQNIIDSWVNENILYSTPNGSNDDWYWLYAAVNCKCLLVTNDEMRDHLFELLGNNFFPKWKERHQVRFTFTANGLELLMPPPYSTILQESQGGSWHIPQSGGDDAESRREWLCVTRTSMDVSESKLSTTLQKQCDFGNEDSHEPASDPSVMSPSGEVTKHCSSRACEEELPALSTPSETLLKLEAAEKVSISTITFEI